MFVYCSLSAQTYTTTIHISGVNDAVVTQCIENNLSKFFTELRRACYVGQEPDFSNIKIDESAKSMILDIWKKTSPFRSIQATY